MPMLWVGEADGHRMLHPSYEAAGLVGADPVREGVAFCRGLRIAPHHFADQVRSYENLPPLCRIEQLLYFP